MLLGKSVNDGAVWEGERWSKNEVNESGSMEEGETGLASKTVTAKQGEAGGFLALVTV